MVVCLGLMVVWFQHQTNLLLLSKKKLKVESKFAVAEQYYYMIDCSAVLASTMLHEPYSFHYNMRSLVAIVCIFVAAHP